MCQVKELDGKLAIYIADHHIAVHGFYAAVYDFNIPITDASVYHAVAIHTTVERGFRMLYEVTIEVKALLQIVRSGGRKACF